VGKEYEILLTPSSPDREKRQLEHNLWIQAVIYINETLLSCLLSRLGSKMRPVLMSTFSTRIAPGLGSKNKIGNQYAMLINSLISLFLEQIYYYLYLPSDRIPYQIGNEVSQISAWEVLD
jgi:hypothetical protein